MAPSLRWHVLAGNLLPHTLHRNTTEGNTLRYYIELINHHVICVASTTTAVGVQVWCDSLDYGYVVVIILDQGVSIGKGVPSKKTIRFSFYRMLLTLSSPHLVPSTAPSSLEWQVVPTVHHNVLQMFYRRRAIAYQLQMTLLMCEPSKTYMFFLFYSSQNGHYLVLGVDIKYVYVCARIA